MSAYLHLYVSLHLYYFLYHKALNDGGFGGASLPLWFCTSVPWADINSSGCCVQFCVCQRLGLSFYRVKKAILRFFRSRAELDLLFSLSHTNCRCFECVCGISFKTDKNIHTILDCFGILKLRKL